MTQPPAAAPSGIHKVAIPEPAGASGSDGPDPEAVAGAVLACPSVAKMSGGIGGEIASYLPGKQVSGVRLRPGTAEIHIVGHYGVPVPQIAAEVRSAVRRIVGPTVRIDVAVDDLDIDLPGEESDESDDSGSSSGAGSSGAGSSASAGSSAPSGTAPGVVAPGVVVAPGTVAVVKTVTTTASSPSVAGPL